jgi:2-acylglycerol O-acyltransferase 2
MKKDLKSIAFSLPTNEPRQILAVMYTLFTFFHGFSLIGIIILCILLNTKFYWLVLLYAVHYYYHFDRCELGGYHNKILRGWSLWKHLANYFPISLYKTVDIPADRNYIFAFVPHGIIPFGCIVNFGTEGNSFSKLFPNLIPHCMTLKSNFYFPLSREYNFLFGLCTASRKCLKWILGNNGGWKSKGQACVLVVGGAEEALYSEQGDYRIIIRKRKGFIKIALETGASLVPVFSFGENDSYSTYITPKNSIIRKVQNALKKLTGIAFPVTWGDGLLPYQNPINTVVGKPIHVNKDENPSQEKINELHRLFIKELIELFEENKARFPSEKSKKLILL